MAKTELQAKIDSGQFSADLNKELCEVRRSRLNLAATVGAIFCALLAVVTWIVMQQPGSLLRTSPPYVDQGAMLFHTITFIAAAFLFRIRSLHTQTVIALDLILFSSNIIARAIASVAFADAGDHFIGIEGIMFALVLHGVFVPTHVLTAVALGVVAMVSFPLAQWFGYEFSEVVRTHWNQIGLDHFQSLVLLNTIGLGVFAALGVLANRILYGLARDAFRAKRLGNYELQEELGSGGMGKVFVGRHRFLRRPTAVKVLDRGLFNSEDAAVRFEREVDLASKLTHPNTISIFDFGRASDGTFYYVMELLNGFDLHKLVRRFGPLSASRTIYLMKQICGSVAEAHELGIVHRDIKANNIIVTRRGGLYDFVKVIDFGLAKRLDGLAKPSDITQQGKIYGTPHYLAPEGVSGVELLDHRSDIYAIGVVGFWCLTGRYPFEGEPMQILMAHVGTEPPKPSSKCEQPVPEELDAIILKCLAKRKEDRYQSVEELEADLLKAASASPWNSKRAHEWWDLNDPEALRSRH